jgi:hypothetical protein
MVRRYRPSAAFSSRRARGTTTTTTSKTSKTATGGLEDEGAKYDDGRGEEGSRAVSKGDGGRRRRRGGGSMTPPRP